MTRTEVEKLIREAVTPLKAQADALLAGKPGAKGVELRESGAGLIKPTGSNPDPKVQAQVAYRLFRQTGMSPHGAAVAALAEVQQCGPATWHHTGEPSHADIAALEAGTYGQAADEAALKDRLQGLLGLTEAGAAAAVTGRG